MYWFHRAIWSSRSVTDAARQQVKKDQEWLTTMAGNAELLETTYSHHEILQKRGRSDSAVTEEFYVWVFGGKSYKWTSTRHMSNFLTGSKLSLGSPWQHFYLALFIHSSDKTDVSIARAPWRLRYAKRQRRTWQLYQPLTFSFEQPSCSILFLSLKFVSRNSKFVSHNVASLDHVLKTLLQSIIYRCIRVV